MKFYINDTKEIKNIEIIQVENNVDVTADVLDAGNLSYNEEMDAYIMNDLCDINCWDMDFSGLRFYINDEKVKFIIFDREAGNEMDEVDTYDEAAEIIENYEAEDRADGTYTEDCYEIVARL